MTSVGRPRSTTIDASVRDAVRSVLVDEGYAAASVERVAREAGVAKTAIYRRWSAKPAMVFAAVVHSSDIVAPADSGTLLGDLRALSHHVVTLLGDPVARVAVPGLLADVAADGDLRRHFFDTLIAPERAVVETILSRARSRGEIGDGVEADDVHAQLLGTVFAWLYLVQTEVPADLAARVTAALSAVVGVEGDARADPA